MPSRHDGRIAARSMTASLLAAPVVVAAAPFWLVSAATRRLAARLPLGPMATDWKELLEFAPDVGWRPRAHLDAYAWADDLFHLTTDGEGWRGPGSLDDADVVVFGDSYAFGHGVDDEAMFTAHMDGWRAKSLGSDGYSMVHAVLWMEALRSRIAGKRVVWMVYAGNDLYDNLRPAYGRYRMPYVRRQGDGWEIETQHVSADPWPIPDSKVVYLDELARMCTAGYDSDRALDAASFLIGRAAELCAEIESQLLVVSVPRRDQIDPERLASLKARSPDAASFDPRRPDRAFEASCRRAGVQFLALAEHLRPDDFQDVDIHWTASGNARVGRVLGSHLSRVS